MNTAPSLPNKGLRAVATFEAMKGAVVLIVGLGLTIYLHHDLRRPLEEAVEQSPLNPASHAPYAIHEAIEKLSNMNLWLLASGSMAYALVRFIEAYGLWRNRVWAEWFGILSGAIYLPFEFYEILHAPSAVKFGITVANILIVAYLVRHRWLQQTLASKEIT